MLKMVTPCRCQRHDDAIGERCCQEREESVDITLMRWQIHDSYALRPAVAATRPAVV